MKEIIKSVIGMAISLLYTASICSQGVTVNSKADTLLREMITSKNVVGITAASSIDGITSWQNSFGYSDLQKQISFTNETLTRLGSIAKPMTAIAIMQLVEHGFIDLDVPIQTYIPDYPIKKKGKITVRYLLSHQSGIAGYKNGREAETKKDYPSLEAASKIFSGRKLKFKPGTSFGYTTYGYVVLGMIIESVSGMTYGEYMQTNIWDKAGMTNTGIEEFGRKYENKSQLYHFEKGKTRLGKLNNLSNRIPGGGLYTTLDDMMKFSNAVLDHLLVSEDTFHEMIMVQSPREDGNPYGFGWFLYGPSPHEGVVIGHSGELTGAANQILINTKSKTVVVILSNTSRTWGDVIKLSSDLLNLSRN